MSTLLSQFFNNPERCEEKVVLLWPVDKIQLCNTGHGIRFAPFIKTLFVNSAETTLSVQIRTLIDSMI